ncbi:hypothetical protein FA95DRAFT_1557686 [Auriscalpium vulgare]|uniref:Uncharacterized protein n=1 Tax=Auriscalpium vulgare TaxID=40419 RepID=A0ACB8RXC4_9AGAM|nr:hypothetical protein FA95DRAFT_1557686 [Auriscalpium vulgare]
MALTQTKTSWSFVIIIGESRRRGGNAAACPAPSTPVSLIAHASMTSALSHILFPTQLHASTLESWAAALHACPDAAHCHLEDIVHHKAVAGMEHELLIVTARHPSGALIVLGVDRNAEEGIEAAESSVSSRYFLNSIVDSAQSASGGASSSSTEQADAAFDGVQVSHDGTPAPILARHGTTLPLSTLTFPAPSSPSTTPDTRPTLLHLSVLLLTLHTHFPAYVLLRHQCYFFARSTVLALAALFAGNETPHPEHAALQATWRGAHVSLYDAGKTALQNMLLLPLLDFPILIVPAGLFAVYSAVRLYDGHAVSNEEERRKINDKKIIDHGIVQKYQEAWGQFIAGRQA